MNNDRETLANIVKDLMSILKAKDLVRKKYLNQTVNIHKK